jgi:hypothetical protein
MSTANDQGAPAADAAVVVVILGKILNIFFLLVSFPALLVNLFVDYSYYYN